MIPDNNKSYPGRKFVQALQVGLVIAIGIFAFSALTRPQPPISAPITAPEVTPGPPLSPVDSIEAGAADFYERARQAHSQNDYQSAIDFYTQTLEHDSSLTDAWLGRGVAYEQSGADERLSRNDFLRYLNLVRDDQIEETFSPDAPLLLDMTEGRVYTITFEAAAGDLFTVTAQSEVRGEPGESGVVDPLLVLVDAQERALAANDDTLRTDGSLISMNARLTNVRIARAGLYTLLIGHAGGGSEGMMTVTMRLR